MAKTPSNMMLLGTTAPSFTLPDVVSGQPISLQDGTSYTATLIMFICNHCPFVIHVQNELIKLGTDYLPKNVRILAISSNDVENYPQDGPAEMKALAKQLNLPYPYLYDETQAVAKAYDAACTPDFFLFDQTLACVYRGQLDGARPGNDIQVTGESLRAALDATLARKPVNPTQYPSLGCNIKWKVN